MGERLIGLKMSRYASIWICCLVFAFGCGRNEEIVSGGKTPDEWIAALEDEKVAVRVEAVKKLGNIGTKDKGAISAMIGAISDKSPKVRKEVIFAIVRTWPASRDALPELEELKDKDEDPAIRKLADQAYENLSSK